MDQLEAAFEIADTDGDGVLDTSEIQEALQVYASHML
jgi:Ca2+-binding EF-hand superfamily protein